MADTQHLLAEEHARRDEKNAADALSREPVKSPEALAEANAIVDKAEQDSKKPEGLLDRFHNKVRDIRYSAISATPGFIVNNSSNILGAMHVGTEMMMLQAGAPSHKNDKAGPQKNILHRSGDAFVKMYTGSVKGSMPKHSFKEVFAGNPVQGFKKYLTDTDAATNYEYGLIEKKWKTDQAIHEKWVSGGKIGDEPKHPGTLEEAKGGFKPGNRWQNRSTLFGLVVWTLSAIIPDKKEDPAEVERMAELQQQSPLKYIGERIRQAVWIPEWREHKRQMIGLGVTLSGVCSVLGAWRRRDPLAITEVVTPGHNFAYKRDSSYLMQSMFTFASGIALMFSLDDERGYSRFGMGMMGRLMFLPTTIAGKFGMEREKGTLNWKKVGEGEPGRLLYTGATVSFQAENMAQGLIGGAEKNPDGTIIDHASIRQDAKLKAKVKGAARTLGEPITEEELNERVEKLKHAKPSNLVSAVSEREMAMPERVMAASERSAVATA